MSSAVTFPPAPNWYCAHAVSALGSACAYAANRDVVLVWHRRSPEGDRPDYPAIRTFRAFEAKAKLVALDLGRAPSEEAGAGSSSMLLATTSEDGLVRAWKVDCGGQEEDYQEPSTCREHDVHREGARDRQKVQCCSWSVQDPGVLYSGDENGKVVVWDTRVNTTRSMSFGKNTMTVMRACPHRRDVVAVGCRMGHVFIVNTAGSGKVMQKIRAHLEDIQGLSWCPVPYNIFEQEIKGKAAEEKKERASSDDGSPKRKSEEDEMLFALSSRDKTFTVWSAKTAMKVAAISPSWGGGGGGRGGHHGGPQSWNSCLWSPANPEVLYTNGTAYAELMSWDLPRLQRTNSGLLQGDDRCGAARVLHREHSRSLTAIALAGESDLVTIGQDRSLVSYRVGEGEGVQFNLPAFSTWVHCISPNAVDPRVLAIGSGDGLIRVWRTGTQDVLADTSYVALPKMSNVKVTSLAWHPTAEGTLAAGTDEGRIVIADAFNPRRDSVKVLGFKHRGQVYNLAWGPNLLGDESDKEPRLFSVADNKAIMHAPNSSERSLDVEELTSAANKMHQQRASPSRSDIAFHPDGGRLIALGGEDGAVEIFDTATLRLAAVLKSFSKLIQSIAWHPLAEQYKDDSGAKEKAKEERGLNKDYWIAVASNETEVHVFDVADSVLPKKTQAPEQQEQKQQEGEGESTDKASAVSVVSKPDFVLSGHHLRVLHLSWSPHDEGKLASVSYDGTAQVWSVPDCRPVANFPGHQGRLVCSLWSPVDPDVVLTGSEDSTLRGWRISQQKDTLPQKKSNKKNKCKAKPEDKKQSSSLSGQPNGGGADGDKIGRGGSPPANGERVEKSRENSEAREKPTASDERQQLRGRRPPKEKNLFPRSILLEKNTKQDVPRECLELMEVKKKLDTASLDANSSDAALPNKELVEGQDRLHLKVFGSREDAAQLLLAEAAQVHLSGQPELSAHLRHFHGDVAGAIRDWISSGNKITEGLVNLAAATGRALWASACSAMAAQLEADGDFARAASYYLMVNKLESAIESLRRGGQFRTAMALARSRLDPSSPALDELSRAWARHAINDGNLDLAAKAFVAGGQLLDASKTLSRRNESDALLSAALLAREAGEEDRARALAAQARERARSEEEAGGGDRPPPDRKEVAERVEREFPETRLNGEKMGDPGDSPPGKEGGSQEV